MLFELQICWFFVGQNANFDFSGQIVTAGDPTSRKVTFRWEEREEYKERLKWSARIARFVGTGSTSRRHRRATAQLRLHGLRDVWERAVHFDAIAVRRHNHDQPGVHGLRVVWERAVRLDAITVRRHNHDQPRVHGLREGEEKKSCFDPPNDCSDENERDLC